MSDIESTALATTPAQQRAAAKWTAEQIYAANIETAATLPSLENATAYPAPLSVNYWSPSKVGDSKDGFVMGIMDADVIDMDSKKPKTMECMFFIEQSGESLLRWYSASMILVGNIKSAIDRGEIIPGTHLTPVRITYKGIKRTKATRNAADWEILRLIVANQE